LSVVSASDIGLPGSLKAQKSAPSKPELITHSKISLDDLLIEPFNTAGISANTVGLSIFQYDA